MSDVEKSCNTCRYYTKETEGFAPGVTSWMTCIHWLDQDDFPPVHQLPNFPFENGCKRYDVEPMLISDEQEEEDAEH